MGNMNLDVPRELSVIVARMIEKEPAKRYSNAAALLEDLAKIQSEKEVSKANTRFSWNWVRQAIVVVAILAALFVADLGKRWVEGRNVEGIPREINLDTVIPFSAIGASADKQFFGQGLGETLNAELSRLTVGRKFQVTTASEARSRGVLNAADARQQFGSNLALSGSLQYADTAVRINVLLVDTASGRTLRTETITGSTFDPFALQDRVVAATVRMIGSRIAPRRT